MSASRSLERRAFCTTAAAALLPRRLTSATTRPNILYCLADDWGFPHAGAYGDRVVKTPVFDRVAREGVLFTHAFSAGALLHAVAGSDADRAGPAPAAGKAAT